MGNHTPVAFGYGKDIIFLKNESLPHHPNALTFEAPFENGEDFKTTYNNYTAWQEAIKKSGESFKYTLNWVSCFSLAVNEEMPPLGGW